jgi:hypothetical protein
MRKLLLLILLLPSASFAEPSKVGRYQLERAGNETFLVDTETGEVRKLVINEKKMQVFEAVYFECIDRVKQKLGINSAPEEVACFTDAK